MVKSAYKNFGKIKRNEYCLKQTIRYAQFHRESDLPYVVSGSVIQMKFHLKQTTNSNTFNPLLNRSLIKEIT